MGRHKADTDSGRAATQRVSIRYVIPAVCLLTLAVGLGVSVVTALIQSNVPPVLELRPGETGTVRVNGGVTSSPYFWRANDAILNAGIATAVAVPAGVLGLLQSGVFGRPSRRFISWGAVAVTTMVMSVVLFLVYQLGTSESNRVTMFTVFACAFVLPLTVSLALMLSAALLASRAFERKMK